MVNKSTSKKKWTFMVYLAGDNNLDGNGVADLGEMKKVGSNDNLNLIAQFDRAGKKGETKRFYLRKGTKLADDAVLKLGETNSGSPDALTDFIRWSVKNYPATRYALVLWNHGGGWDDTDVYADQRLRSVHRPARGPIRHTFFETSYRKAVGAASGGARRRAILYDDDAKDFLDNIEMKNVLAGARKAAGHKIDVLGMDACLMSMIEVVYQVRASVRYAVGSEQTEPVDGWPYHTILAGLAGTPDMDPGSFASLIVNKYLAFYPVSEPVTQSAFDLSKSTAMMNAVKELATALGEGLRTKETIGLAILQIRRKVQSYEVPDNIDLVDFCKLLMVRDEVGVAAKTACQKVVDAAGGPDGIIVQAGNKGESVKNSYGAAIYFPLESLSPLYAKLDFDRQTGWGAFLNQFLTASRQR